MTHVRTYYIFYLHVCKYFMDKIFATASDNLPGLPPPILQSFQLSSVFSFFSKIRCHHRKVCILWPMIIDPSSLAVLNFIIIIDHSEIVVVVERWVGGGVRFFQREWQWAGTYVGWGGGSPFFFKVGLECFLSACSTTNGFNIYPFCIQLQSKEKVIVHIQPFIRKLWCFGLLGGRYWILKKGKNSIFSQNMNIG